MRTTLSFVSLLMLGVVSTAMAQTTAAVTETASPAGPAEAASGADPNIDRAFLLPTAMTQPKGSVTYNNYELLLHGLTYGITDNLQTTVTVLSPMTKDMPVLGLMAIKGRMLATDRLHLSLQASAGVGHSFGDAQSSTGYTLGSGAFASLCLRDDCSSLLSASVTYQLALGSGGARSSQFVIYGGSLVHAVSTHVKLLAELTSAAGKVNADFDNLPGALASYGVRFHTGALAGDVGFVRPMGSELDDEFLLGLPFVNVSYRWR
jgi:hypothetical protein